MRRFLIVANGTKANSKEYATLVEDCIKNQGGSFFTQWIKRDTNLEREMKCMDERGFEAVIVIGGDGTLLHASRAYKELKIPIVGINIGTIGFLCEIDVERIKESIDRLFKDNFIVESRMLLFGRVDEGDGDDALNEIAIYRSGHLCVISLELYVNGEYLTTYHGDGLVIATPTGSTGYSMSCGGPIVNPASKMIVVTPIAPHSISASRSIVLEDTVDIEIRPVYRHPEDEILISFDGATTYSLTKPVKIRKSKEEIQLIRLKKTGFLEILKEKL